MLYRRGGRHTVCKENWDSSSTDTAGAKMRRKARRLEMAEQITIELCRPRL